MNHASKLPLVYAINLPTDFFPPFFLEDIVEVMERWVEDKDTVPPL